MTTWKIAWSQCAERVPGKAWEITRHVSEVRAYTVVDAVAAFNRQGWCNANIDAVWNPAEACCAHLIKGSAGEGQA